MVAKVGDSDFNGKTKGPSGKKLLKGDKTHTLFKVVDKKDLKALGLNRKHDLFNVPNVHVSLLLEEVIDAK